MNNGNCFQRRSGILLVLVFATGLLCIASLIANGILKRDILLEECRRIAWRTGMIPAIRGRILDKEGHVLAKTEICYGLKFSSVPENPERVRQIMRKVSSVLGKKCGSEIPHRGVICEKLSPDECIRCRELLKSCPELRLYPVFQRQYKQNHPLTGCLGTVRSPEEGVSAGISGIEEKYDSTLAGTPGRFAVMLDRHGEWVPGTVRIIYEPVHGQDAVIDPEKEKEEFAQ